MSGHDLSGQLGQRHADGFADIRHGARRPRIDLKHINFAVLHRELHIHQPADLQLARHGPRGGLQFGQNLRRKRKTRDHAGTVTTVHARLLNVLHDPADQGVDPVAEAVDINFRRILEKTVDQDRPVRAGRHGRADVTPEILRRVDDFHRAATEDE